MFRVFAVKDTYVQRGVALLRDKTVERRLGDVAAPSAADALEIARDRFELERGEWLEVEAVRRTPQRPFLLT